MHASSRHPENPLRHSLAAGIVMILMCLLSVSAQAQQVTQQLHTIAIATYNVRNLFDQYDNPYTTDEITKPKLPKELDVLATCIKKVDADILFLQEIEYGGVLDQFAKDRLPEYPYIVENPTSDPRGATLGILSKVPIKQIVSHRLDPLTPDGRNLLYNRFARDLLRIDIEPQPGLKISLYNVHLKSKRNTDGDPHSTRWRLAEAMKIAEILKNDYNSGIKKFVIMGDFNDTFESNPLHAIRNALPAPLVDANDNIPLKSRVTYEDSRFSEAIDFIFISPDLAPARIPDSGVIFRGKPFTSASDHFPVKAVLQLNN